MGTGRRNFCFLFPSELQIFVKGGKVKPWREEESCFYFKKNLKPRIKLDFKVLFFVSETSNIDEMVCASFKPNCPSIKVVNG